MTTEDPLTLQLYETLRQSFGSGTNELFQMEMPARLLEMGNYHYDGSDTINAQQVKPPAVAEAEFRLANGMLNMSNVVGGPNGSKFSESYQQVLFGLAPANTGTSAALEKLAPDQAKINAWLFEMVLNFDPPASDLLSMIPDDLGLPRKPSVIKEKNPNPRVESLRDPGTTPEIPRIDLFQKLLDVYQAERFRWAQFKQDARPSDDASDSKWATYDRLLSTYAPVIDAKLEALWAVLLSRGEYHRVRKYISYLDIQTAGEALQKAKESLRASVTRSVDDAEDIYPVVMTPNNWASYLTTNFRPEDLLANVEVARSKLLQAEKDRKVLTLRRDALVAGNQDIKALQKAASDAAVAARSAKAQMVQGYAENASSCIQLYFDVVFKKAQDKIAAIKALTDINKDELNASLAKFAAPPLTAAQWKSLGEMQTKCLQNQAAAETANDAYSRAQLAEAKARGNDPTMTLESLNEKIQLLTMDIEYYQSVLRSSSNPTGVEVTKLGEDGKAEATKTPAETKPAPETTPQTPPSQDGASIWQSFLFDSKNKASKVSKLSTSSVSHSDWSAGLWWASAGGHSDSTSSSGADRSNITDTQIQIGLRAMKVTIDRPWFNGQLLGQTKEFFNFNANKISAGNPQTIHDTLASGGTVDGSETMIPTWATSFIVVKDVHIIMKSEKSFSESERLDMQAASTSGGGFLCFQASKSSSSSDHREAFTMKDDDKTISIRIPAPQILGWCSQLAPEDHSLSMYTPFGDKEFEKLKVNGDVPTPVPTP